MKSESYDFNATTILTSSPATGDYVYAYMPLVISLDTLALEDTRTQTEIEQGVIASATVTVTNGTNSVSQTITVNSTKKRYTVGLELAVSEGERWRVTVSASHCHAFYESGTYEVIGGFSSEWAATREGYPLDSQITVQYDPAWVMDDQNDGYPYPVGTDPTPFNGFEKDKNGYPKNFGVWKLDSQNDGYPWQVGYLPINAKSGVLVKNMTYKNAKVLKKNVEGWEKGSKEDILDLIGYEV